MLPDLSAQLFAEAAVTVSFLPLSSVPVALMPSVAFQPLFATVSVDGMVRV